MRCKGGVPSTAEHTACKSRRASANRSAEAETHSACVWGQTAECQEGSWAAGCGGSEGLLGGHAGGRGRVQTGRHS